MALMWPCSRLSFSLCALQAFLARYQQQAEQEQERQAWRQRLEACPSADDVRTAVAAQLQLAA